MRQTKFRVLAVLAVVAAMLAAPPLFVMYRLSQTGGRVREGGAGVERRRTAASGHP
jgi:hypothetical protein